LPWGRCGPASGDSGCGERCRPGRICPAASAPAAVGSRLVIWNGDDTGGGAQGWASCDKTAECKTKLGPDSGSGVNGSTALKFHGEGPGWLGMGWNLFGWYPETAGSTSVRTAI